MWRCVQNKNDNWCTASPRESKCHLFPVLELRILLKYGYKMIYDKRGGIKNMYQIHQNFGVKLSNLEPDIPPELPTWFPSFAASVCVGERVFRYNSGTYRPFVGYQYTSLVIQRWDHWNNVITQERNVLTTFNH